MRLGKRKKTITRPEDIEPKNLEEIFRDYDEKVQKIDNRRIAQQSSLSDGAALADVITAFNTLIAALNGSDLTNDD